MKKIMGRILPVLAIALVIAAVSGVASAQVLALDGAFTTNYFSNNTTAGAPAGTVRISNDGASTHNLCANIYVFAADQQMTQCCACTVTPNGLAEANIKTSLTRNPLTGVVPNEGVIQIVASTGPVCDPADIGTISSGLTAWTTHIENKVGTTFPVSVTQNSPSTLSSAELAALETDCSFAIMIGSGQGICAGCTE
jgi:hypothetical protein